MAITSERLLRGIKRRITIPANQILFSDDDMLEVADDIISSKLCPMIMSLNQDYFIYLEEEALVASKTDYAIPYRAIGRTLRFLTLRDSNNNVRDLNFVTIEDAANYANSASTVGFHFLSDKIHLVPDVPSTYTGTDYLQKRYPLPPSKLVPASEIMVVTGNITATSVDVSSVPASFIAGANVDFIQAQQGNTIYAMDKAIVSVASLTINFATSDIPSLLAVGDYIALAGESPVVNFIPDVAYSYIETRTSERVLQAIGDYEGLKNLKEDAKEEKQDLEKIMEPRILGNPRVFINRNGLVRGAKFNQRSWLYGNS